MQTWMIVSLITLLTVVACVGVLAILTFNSSDSCKGPGMPKSVLTPKPRWMAKYPSKTIFQIALPGSHDSSAYTLKFPPSLANYKALAAKFVEKFTKTQEHSIGDQLKYGIRALDFRINTVTSEPWLSHTAFSVKLTDACEQVSRFVAENPTEVVVIMFKYDFELKDIAKKDWKKVGAVLDRHFLNKTIPFVSATAPIRALTGVGKNIILINVDDEPVEANVNIWPSEALENRWYNTSDLDEMMHSLHADASDPASRSDSMLFASGPVLTPDFTKDILPGMNPFNVSCKWTSLKNMADKANYRFTIYAKNNPLPGLSIVMHDFVNEDVIREVIKSND